MAEFLIKARDPIDIPKDAEKAGRIYRRGDVVVVMPDGHEWGKDERLPKFVVVKIPNMSVETGKKYIKPYYSDTGLLDSDGNKIMKMVSRRRWKILLDNVPASIKNELKTGVVEVSWTNVKSYVYDKILLTTK